MFATVWVGMLDLVGRSLTYASAGHPPPLLMESNRKARELDHRTLPIGLRQGHQGRATRIAIPPTSSILLYTDGLIEATHDILAGIARLHHVATEFAGNPSAHPAAAIRHLVINGAPVQDDIAILVVGIDFDVAEQFLQRTSFDSHNAIAARIARRAFVSSLAPGDFSENDIDNAEVVFGELCGNVARYAPGIVDIVVDRSGVQVVLHVLDRGAGFRHISRLPADPFSETGRGLFIVSLMTAELSVSLRDGGGSHARAVLVGRSPASLSAETLPSIDDQVASAG
jgi:anti-sigma regulatory factor (Ser/Thr protein kinase)